MNKQRMIEILFDMMEILVDTTTTPELKLRLLYALVVEAMDIAGVLEKKQ